MYKKKYIFIAVFIALNLSLCNRKNDDCEDSIHIPRFSQFKNEAGENKNNDTQEFDIDYNSNSNDQNKIKSNVSSINSFPINASNFSNNNNTNEKTRTHNIEKVNPIKIENKNEIESQDLNNNNTEFKSLESGNSFQDNINKNEETKENIYLNLNLNSNKEDNKSSKQTKKTDSGQNIVYVIPPQISDSEDLDNNLQPNNNLVNNQRNHYYRPESTFPNSQYEIESQNYEETMNIYSNSTLNDQNIDETGQNYIYNSNSSIHQNLIPNSNAIPPSYNPDINTNNQPFIPNQQNNPPSNNSLAEGYNRNTEEVGPYGYPILNNSNSNSNELFMNENNSNNINDNQSISSIQDFRINEEFPALEENDEDNEDEKYAENDVNNNNGNGNEDEKKCWWKRKNWNPFNKKKKNGIENQNNEYDLDLVEV